MCDGSSLDFSNLTGSYSIDITMATEQVTLSSEVTASDNATSGDSETLLEKLKNTYHHFFDNGEAIG